MFDWFMKNYTEKKNLDELARGIISLNFISRTVCKLNLIDKEEYWKLVNLLICSEDIWISIARKDAFYVEPDQETLDERFECLSRHLSTLCEMIEKYDVSGFELKINSGCSHIEDKEE